MKPKKNTKRIRLNQVDHNDLTYQNRATAGLTKQEKVNLKRNSDTHVKSLVQKLKAGEKLDQLIVTPQKGGNRYAIVSGFHRFAALRKVKDNRYKFTVEVVDPVPPEMYLTLNQEHQGLPLTACQAEEQRWQHWQQLEGTGLTNRKLATNVGVSVSTVQRWRRIRKELMEAEAWDILPKDAVTNQPQQKPALYRHKVVTGKITETEGLPDTPSAVDEAVEQVVDAVCLLTVPQQHAVLTKVVERLDLELELDMLEKELELMEF